MLASANIRCFIGSAALGFRAEPSPWMREIYANRDRMESRIRHERGEEGSARTLSMILGVSPEAVIEMAYRDLRDNVMPMRWSDPVV